MSLPSRIAARTLPLEHRSLLSNLGRRDWLRLGATGLVGMASGVYAPAMPAWAATPKLNLGARREAGFEVREIERMTVRLEYRPAPRRAMDRELPHWRYSELCRVTLANGAVGIGETLLYYTWGVPSDEQVRRTIGQNAVDRMWDDRLGAGLQMALMDAVGQGLEVPIHALMGEAWTQTTPLSWWNIDMPPEDMASECRTALENGYLSYKTKGRPWFDLWAQVEQSAAVVPERFKIDMDFNDTLLDAERAIPVLKELEAYPQIDIYESPIPQSDVAGNRAIRDATRVQIALHYGTPSPEVVVREQVCDGFVVGGGASRVMGQGRFCEQVEMPFWLQLVGSGVTAAFSLHFGAVLRQAVWPAINCHQLYEHDLLAEPIEVVDGKAPIPQRPGLGIPVDWDAAQQRRVPKPPRRPEPKRLMEVTWSDGRRMDIANTGDVNFMLKLGMQGAIPFFERGVQTHVIPNDGSRAWLQRYQAAQQPRLQMP